MEAERLSKEREERALSVDIVDFVRERLGFEPDERRAEVALACWKAKQARWGFGT
jgi:hypothetical protein